MLIKYIPYTYMGPLGRVLGGSCDRSLFVTGLRNHPATGILKTMFWTYLSLLGCSVDLAITAGRSVLAV